MIKTSVKKPFTVLVAVIMIIALGVVSLMNMTADLLPELSLPYMIVITTYPGAGPEKVESLLTSPLEGALGTVSGVKNLTSTSADNYSTVQLEFEDGTNMESALVKVSNAIDSVKSYLPEEAGNPTIMEISMDMMASTYLGVSYEGMTQAQLSEFVDEKLVPYIERQDGVANVNSVGLVKESILIELDESKVDDLNDRILATVDSAFSDAYKQVNDAKTQLIDGQKEIDNGYKEIDDGYQKLEDSKKEIEENRQKYEDGRKEFDEGKEEFLDQLYAIEYAKDQVAQLLDNKPSPTMIKMLITTRDTNTNPVILESAIRGIGEYVGAYNMLRQAAGLSEVDMVNDPSYNPMLLTAEDIDKISSKWDSVWASANANLANTYTLLSAQESTFDDAEKQLDTAKEQLDSAGDALEDGKTQLEDAKKQLEDAQKKIDDGWKSYNDGLNQLAKQRTEARGKASADQLISLNTLSQLIYAQNFEMPAGYIKNDDGESFLVKVGENFTSAEALGDVVLTNIKDVGDVRLCDVANITYINNEGEQYAKMDGRDAILLAVFKSSTASTNAVSDKVNEAMDQMEEEYDGLKVTTLLDQGEYIDILVKSVLESMIIGALLAIIILAIFLKDVKPTLVVAISIPLSVLLAIVCMYFSKISLNLMTLAGLALGIGMLVDNSIVVIENIYRLRGLGLTAAKASVKGAKEVAGPIISSTLTTICVFLPILFANGLVKELILPMCLTVTFCLVASLVIALSVVPAAGSTLLRNSKEKSHSFFDKIMDAYEKVLKYCLKVKVLPLGIAIVLLAVSVWQVLRMGIVMIPQMATEPIQVMATMPEEMEKEEAYKLADEVLDSILKVDGIETVGAMPSSALVSTVSAQAGSGGFRNFIFYVMLPGDNPTAKEITAVTKDIEAAVKDFPCDISMSTSSVDTSALLGSGLSIKIYGDDLTTLMSASQDVMKIVEQVEGYEDINNAQEDASKVLHLQIDKNKAMSLGLSVAQIYSEINTKLTDEVSATTLNVAGTNMDVLIRNEYQVPTSGKLLSLPFKVSQVDEDGDTVTKTYHLSDFAELIEEDGIAAVNRYNLNRYITVNASVKEGKNATLLARELEPLLKEYEAPKGCRVEIGGESDSVNNMVTQMAKLMALGFLFIYLVMVAQFQSLLSPFIILFTIPLAFTGGLLGLVMLGEQLSIMSLMGFMILMGTVVNNGIVFVDYANQLRIEGMERREALVETGKTRMRPILMTALTTILAMTKMVIGSDMAGQMGRGMAIVIMGGLLYATFMTLFIVPVIYDILFKRQPLVVDVETE